MPLKLTSNQLLIVIMQVYIFAEIVGNIDEIDWQDRQNFVWFV